MSETIAEHPMPVNTIRFTSRFLNMEMSSGRTNSIEYSSCFRKPALYSLSMNSSYLSSRGFTADPSLFR